MNHTTPSVLVISLVFVALCNTQNKHVLNQLVIYAAYGRLCRSLWKLDVASLFINVHLVGKSHKFSPPISAFVELCSNANLPCLVNLAL